MAKVVEGVFAMEASEQHSVDILIESADTVATAVYKKDKGKEKDYHKNVKCTDI